MDQGYDDWAAIAREWGVDQETQLARPRRPTMDDINSLIDAEVRACPIGVRIGQWMDALADTTPAGCTPVALVPASRLDRRALEMISW